MVIIIAVFNVRLFNEKDDIEETIATPTPTIDEPEPTPKVEPLIVSGDKTNVIITNNLDRDVSLKVTYNVYSRWFNADYDETKVFDVPANSEKSFRVYNNDGCGNNPCSVGIMGYEEAE